MPSLMDLTALLPVDRAREALLPPVRLMREAAVIAARTTRHWELALAGEDPSDRVHPADGADETFSSAAQARASSTPSQAERADAADRSGSMSGAAEVVDIRDLSTDDLPVEGWPSMSLADAQASLSALSPAELAALLAYEQAHGHRIAFEQMLQHRLERSGAVLADGLPE